jgi:transcriptional regulator with XRE-family HTH domain
MNTHELQQLKMAWIAAKEAGDTQAQFTLLQNHPDAQDALIDFILAYHATNGKGTDTALLPLTQRATQTAMERVFGNQAVATNLRELRTKRGFTLVSAAKGLRLGVDVWKKFEDGAIELVSLSALQLERLAAFFHVSASQFGTMLTNSQPAFTLNRRQTAGAARQAQHPARKQSFAEAIEKSTMTKEEQRLWLE